MTTTTSHTASLVWWNANDVHIDDGQLRTSLETARAGLGALVRRPNGAHSAMRRAMARRQQGLDSSWSWEEVGVDGDTLVIALAESTSDAAARSWSAGVRLTIEVSKATGFAATSRTPTNDDEANAVSALMKRYALERAELTQGDVRNIVLHILLDDKHGAGVRVKESGSIYLLRAPHDGIVDDVKQSFAAAGLHLRTMPVYADSLAQLAGDVRTGLLGEIDEVRSAITKASESLSTGGSVVRPSTLALRHADLEQLRKKAVLFGVVLAGEMAAVQQAINDARANVATLESQIAAKLR